MVPDVVYSRQERAYIRSWNIDLGSALDLLLADRAVHTLLMEVYALVRSASLVLPGMLSCSMCGAQASKECECWSVVTRSLVEKGGEERRRRNRRAFSACVTEVISRVSTVGSSEVGRGNASRCKGDAFSPPNWPLAAMRSRRGYMASRNWTASSY